MAVRLTPDGLRHVRAGHPWVFERSIVSATGDGHPGDLAVIFDDQRRFAAIGLWDPASAIRIKVLHRGSPRPIDAEFFAGRLASAWDLRQPLRAAGDTTAFRWVHGENDGLPGLVVDVYDATAVVKLYSTAWPAYLAEVVPLLVQLGGVDTVVCRLARAVRKAGAGPLFDGAALLGEAPTAPLLYREHGLVFEADVVHGQKTGAFLDQRENRQRVRSLSRDATVLDVFAATGGFSVYAAAGGASQVTSVDLSAPTLAAAQRNIGHNATLAAVRACRHTVRVGDAFDVLRGLGGERRRFDVVILDPPSFARRAADVPQAQRAYAELTALGLGVLAEGGRLVQASCSSRIDGQQLVAAMTRGAQLAGWELGITGVTGHAEDHPVGFPEGEYLQAVWTAPQRRRRSG